MFGVVDRVYTNMRRNEIHKAKWILRKIKINMVEDIITNACWKFGIQYKIVFKTSNIILMDLKGNKTHFILEYHRCNIVEMKNFNIFINVMFQYNVDKGIYITTGTFENKIVKLCDDANFANVRLVDNFKFIKEQLGICGRAADIFKKSRLNFYRYLPQ